jgi:Ca-activated chloride channel family protein
MTTPDNAPRTTDHDPAGDPRLTARPDRRLIRADGRSERFLLVDVAAPTRASDASRGRPPVNLAFVLDRSGSMGGSDKLGLAKQAVLEAVHRLDAPDRFAVVTYDDRVDVVVPGTEATPSARRDAAERLRDVRERNSTDLHAGWLSGCEQVASALGAEGVNRVLLLTDGLANRGLTDPDELARLAFDLRQRGVSTSTFGLGADFDEALLQAMADSGGGHFYFIGNVAQMRDHITGEVGETLEVVAREVVLELTLPESLRIEPLSPFRVEHRGGRARVYLGDMVSGQVLSVVLRLTFEQGEVGRDVGVIVRVTDASGAFEGARPAPHPVTLAWTYADSAANDEQPRDRDVDRVVARLFAERARQEAVRLNREGRYADARDVLDGVRRRVAAYEGSDPELAAVVARLELELPTYAAPMPEMDRKRVHFLASASSRMRTGEGRSIRRP